jgi:hypothetical protein
MCTPSTAVDTAENRSCFSHVPDEDGLMGGQSGHNGSRWTDLIGQPPAAVAAGELPPRAQDVIA